jgi:hypothetical protein
LVLSLNSCPKGCEYYKCDNLQHKQFHVRKLY